MFQIILLILATATTIALVLLIRSYEYMSVSELKRQARSGNPLAKKVYPIRSYGMQLWIVLWGVLGLMTSSIILLLHSLIGPIWTIAINVPLIILIHAVLPWTKHPKPGLYLAALTSPYLVKLLRLLNPILRRVELGVGKWIQPEPFLMIQSKNELIEILHHNAQEFDNISKDELKIAENALLYGEKLVGEVMTPLNAVHFISSTEHLTPVLLGELHDSGYSRFPVFSGSNQNIVGTLFIKDALKLKNDKTASAAMRPEVLYINERQSLDIALGAFVKTRHHLFVVVNEFEDVVGVLSIEDIIEQIIGHPILDEFDKYDDLREVARQTALKKHQERAETTTNSK